MKRLAALIAACAAASTVATWSPPANALALGEIELQSRLNEPLTARIPLRLSAGDDFQSLRISVADPEDFDRSGLQYDDYLISVELLLEPAIGSAPAYVLVSSSEIAREPFIDLMIEARAAGNRVLRNYTILLDPPVLTAAPGTAPVAAPAATPSAPQPQPVPVPSDSPTASYQVESAAVAPPAGQDETTGLPSVSSTDPEYFQSGSGWVEGEVPAASDSDTAVLKIAEAPAATAGKRYGPIDRKETLWSIAYALRPDPSITMDQMQLAIFRANPQAFDGNINRMLSGVVLEIPSAADIRAINPATAKAEVARQRSDYVLPAPSAAAPQQVPATEEPDLAAYDAAETDFDDDYDTDSLYADEPANDDDFADSGLSDGFDDDAGTDDATRFDDGSDFAETETDTADSDSSASDVPPAAARSDRPLTALERLRAGRAAGTAAPATTAQPDAAPIQDEPAVVADADSAVEDAGFDAPEDVMDGGSAEDGHAPSDQAPAPEAPAASAPAPAAPIAAPGDEPDGGLPWALIGGLGALILAVLAWLGVRRRKAAAEADESNMAVAMEDDGSDQADANADEFQAADTAVLDESEFGLGDDAEPKPREDIAPDVPVIDEPEGLGETAILDAEDAPAAEAGAAEDAAEREKAEQQDDAMAATMQFDANTISLDLSGDDPISEADVHMAYGATDEAQSVMEAAVQAAPDNAAYRNKLAEVYFTANAAEKFVAHARDSESVLKGGTGEGWQKLLILGQQIAPDEPLFAQADAAELQSADFDFGSDPDPLDTGEADAGASDGLDIADPAADASADADTDGDDDGGLELDLGDLDVGGDDAVAVTTADATEAPATSAAADDDDNSLEFDLGDFDLGEDAADGEAADDDSAPASAKAAADDDRGLEFDLGDLGQDSGDDTPASTADSAADDDAPAEFDLGDLDLGEDSDGDSDALGDLGDFDLGDDAVSEPDDSAVAVDEAGLDALLGDSDGAAEVPEQADDDVATKLDLARAYVDMGDKELAESLLKDVVEAGDDVQKAEASELMSKLTGG